MRKIIKINKMPIIKKKKMSGIEEKIDAYFESGYEDFLNYVLDNNISPMIVKKSLKNYFASKLTSVDDTVDFIYSDDY